MAPQQQGFSDIAIRTTLTALCNPGDTTISVVSTAGYPSAGLPFVVTLDRSLIPGDGNPEEKVLVSGSFSSTTLNVITRGYGGTGAQTHQIGASCEHTLDAGFLQDLSAQRFAATTKGDLPYVATTAGSLLGRIPIGAVGKVLGSLVSGIPGWVDGLQSLLTQTGDIVVAGSPGIPQRLGVGTSGQLLQSNGATVVYGADAVEIAARSAAIAAEASTRAAADTTNANAIAAETTRAEAAEPAGILTTAGDTLYENATPAPARLPIGNSGQRYTVVAGLPAWASQGLALTAQNGAYNANDGDWVQMTGAHATALPTPTTRRVVLVQQMTDAAATVTTGSGAIVGLGVPTSATSVPLAKKGAFALFEADGTNWNIVAGQIDSGYLALPGLTTGVSAGSVAPQYRQQGNQIDIIGQISITTVFGLSYNTAFTLPAGARPTGTRSFTIWVAAQGSDVMAVNSDGTCTARAAAASGGPFVWSLDGIHFRVD